MVSLSALARRSGGLLLYGSSSKCQSRQFPGSRLRGQSSNVTRNLSAACTEEVTR